MIENLTRLGVDLGAPTLVAYAVVALISGLLGMAVGSFLELLRTRRLARREFMDPTTWDQPAPAPAPIRQAPAYSGLPAGYEAHGMAWAAPAVAFSEPGLRFASPSGSPTGPGLGPEIFSESGLEEWYTGNTTGRRSGNALKLFALVTLATLSVAAAIFAGLLLLQQYGVLY